MLKAAKVVQIGNSKGIRLPKAMLVRAGLGEDVVLEQTEDGIMIRPKKEEKLSWEETFKAMSLETEEDWSEWVDLDIEHAD
jgi:antitoxin MazE